MATSSNVNVSDSTWHSVVVIKSGSHVQLLVDNQVTAETTVAPAQIIGSSADLYMGGTLSESTRLHVITQCELEITNNVIL